MAGTTITNTSAALDASILKLAPTFQTAIKTTIEAESTPLKTIQTKRDSLDVTKGVYTDVKTNLDAMQSALQTLISTQVSFGLTLVSKAIVTPGTTGSTVMTATTSDTAAAGDYEISSYTGLTGIQLAKAESRASSDSLTSAEIALGKSGTFWLGGSGTASLGSSWTSTTSVTATALSSVAEGQRELGSGSYSVQVRDSGSVRQFRLVNADGSAMSIQNTSGTGFTSSWQTLTDGEYDTGRGLSFTLSTSGSVGSTTLPEYTAKGVSITISESDTKRTIAAAINAALQPEGRDFKASIISNQLVFTGAQTGENHSLVFSDSADLLGITGDARRLQAVQNARFSVNGMDVSRANNTGLTDVLDGVTLNLSSDAAGKSAHLSISSSTDKAVGLMNALVTKFNAAFAHLTQKLATTSRTDAATGKTTYTRGALASETTFSSLRNDMSYRMSHSYANSGSFTNLSEIGLSFDKDMKLTFDSAKFTDALKNNSTDLTALLDASLGNVNTMLSNYTGTSGILSRSLSSVEEQRASYDKRIAKINNTLTARKQSLYNTYLSYQNQLVEMGYQQQIITAMYGSSSTTSTSA